jgi:hypothetical protein
MRKLHVYNLVAVIPLVVISGLIEFRAEAQVDFENLNFEDANPGTLTQGPNGPPYALDVSAIDALPYWTVYYGYSSTPETEISVNDPSLGAAAVTLIGPQDSPIDGNYSVLLQPGGSLT